MRTYILTYHGGGGVFLYIDAEQHYAIEIR